MVWDNGLDELNKFIEQLNTSSEKITFSSEISNRELNFPDVKVKLNNGKLKTELFTKPTDRNTYLPYNSAHPQYCKKGLPFGQFLRIRWIYSDNNAYMKHAAKKAAQLIQHGYPKETLLESTLKAFNRGRESALLPCPINNMRAEMENTYLTTTYNASFNGLRTQVESTWDLLGHSSTMCFLQEKPLKVGYRRLKSLRDILVRARLPKIKDDTNTATIWVRDSCKNSKCRYCSFLNKSGNITSHFRGRTYTTIKNVDCMSNNLVYCISCKMWVKQYVGQTMNSVKTRFQGHFYLIKHKKVEPEEP